MSENNGLTIALVGLMVGCAQNVATSSSEEMARSYTATPKDQAFFDKSKQLAISECSKPRYANQEIDVSCKVVSDTVIIRLKLKARYEWKAGFDFARMKDGYKADLICSDIPWVQNALEAGMAFQIQAVGKDQSELFVLEDCATDKGNVI